MVGSLQVEHGDADSQENVCYYPNKQKATITFVDAKTGKTIKLIPDFDNGKQLSWLGLVLATIGTAFSGLWRKKRDDE